MVHHYIWECVGQISGTDLSLLNSIGHTSVVRLSNKGGPDHIFAKYLSLLNCYDHVSVVKQSIFDYVYTAVLSWNLHCHCVPHRTFHSWRQTALFLAARSTASFDQDFCASFRQKLVKVTRLKDCFLAVATVLNCFLLAVECLCHCAS